jgi:predicted Na+-dependent transporter
MPLLTPLIVVAGVLLADNISYLAFLVPWVFALMTFGGSLGSNFKSFQHALVHPLPLFIVIAVLHIIAPLLAWSTGHIFFYRDSYTITGLILGMIIPTGITSVIWVSMYKGNIGLTLSIILVDTILSPFIVPFSLSLLVGEQVHMEVWGIMRGLIGMIVIPSVLGMAVNQYVPKVSKQLSAWLAPVTKLGLIIVVSINSSVIAPYFHHLDYQYLLIALTVFFLAFSGYVISWLLGKLLRNSREVIVSLIYTGGMRNISVGAVLAVGFFPPAVAVPVITGMLFQQVLAGFYGFLIGKYLNKPVTAPVHEGTA